MYLLEDLKDKYLFYCRTQKELNTKTLKAYRIDLTQFIAFSAAFADPFTRENLNAMRHTNQRPQNEKLPASKHFFTFSNMKKF